MDDGDFVRVTDAPLSDTTFEYTYDTLKGDTTYTFAVSSAGNNGTVSALSNTKHFRHLRVPAAERLNFATTEAVFSGGIPERMTAHSVILSHLPI